MKKEIVKDLLPPVLLRYLKRFSFGSSSPRWTGDYETWDKALEQSTGYDSEDILEKVKNAQLKVKNGQAVYERDSVLFDEIQYSWPVLAGLLWVYAQENKLDLIDFGGSLGSTYYQNRKFLSYLDNLNWSIVEQKLFTDAGIEHFQNDELKFYYTINACLKEHTPNCILLSSVLPYIKAPYELLTDILSYRFRYIILDKMPFIKGERDRITVQKTPPSIYPATYPAWFFGEVKFRKFIEVQYHIVEEFRCKDEATVKSEYKGMILKLK